MFTYSCLLFICTSYCQEIKQIKHTSQKCNQIEALLQRHFIFNKIQNAGILKVSWEEEVTKLMAWC